MRARRFAGPNALVLGAKVTLTVAALKYRLRCRVRKVTPVDDFKKPDWLRADRLPGLPYGPRAGSDSQCLEKHLGRSCGRRRRLAELQAKLDNGPTGIHLCPSPWLFKPHSRRSIRQSLRRERPSSTSRRLDKFRVSWLPGLVPARKLCAVRSLLPVGPC
jgi:hypothetical protein